MGREKAKKPKKVKVNAESQIKAAREVRTYGFDIPKFGFYSAILVVGTIMATMFLPDVAPLLGLDPNLLTVTLGSFMTVAAVFISQYFIEGRKNVTWKTIVGYFLLFLAVLMIFYFWIYVQMPI